LKLFEKNAATPVLLIDALKRTFASMMNFRLVSIRFEADILICIPAKLPGEPFQPLFHG